MANTVGYHVVKSAYGLWLPGDDRGHWSSAWDEQIGYYEPGMLHGGDPVRERMARERMKFAPLRWDVRMQQIIAATIDRCQRESAWSISAAAIEPTHFHLLITYSGRDIYATMKWVAQQITKAVHRDMGTAQPVFCEGRWISVIYDNEHWDNTRGYIERHNERRGVGAKPFAWVGRGKCKARDGIAGRI